jgi:hypothetical protein
VSRATRVVAALGGIAVLAIAAWVGWELHQGPTVTRQVAAGSVVPLASHLGTATVPAGWAGRETSLRSGLIPWLQFKASRTFSRQIIELSSADGLASVTLDVTRGPGAWRESLARDRAQAKRNAANPYSMQTEQKTDPGSDGFGGRKALYLGRVERAGDSLGMRGTVYVWDRTAPAVLTFRDDHKPQSPESPKPDVLWAGLHAFDFAAVSH